MNRPNSEKTSTTLPVGKKWEKRRANMIQIEASKQRMMGLNQVGSKGMENDGAEGTEGRCLRQERVKRAGIRKEKLKIRRGAEMARADS